MPRFRGLMTSPSLPPTLPPRRSWPRRLLNRLEVDQAVFFAVLSRAWQFLAGPVTMLLIAGRFSPAEQGYFYTFASLMGWQTALELGLHGIIVFLASHEWAALTLQPDGRIGGDPSALSRLAQLDRAMGRWYAVVSVLFMFLMAAFGLWFFGRQPAAGVSWIAPWLALNVLHGGLLVLLPRTSLLEGCRQVVVVNRVRFAQAASGHAVVWLCLLAGCGLWTAVVSAAVRLAWDLGLVFGLYGPFFASLRAAPREVAFRWGREVWPLQWKTAIRAGVAFTSVGLMVPVVFDYHGETEAGRLGMTWSAIVAIEAAALAWVQTRLPLFGTLIARRDFRELDRVFWKVLQMALLACALGGAILCGVVVVLPHVPHAFAHKLSDRLLPLLPTALFCLGTLLTMAPRCAGYYVLAHKRDPFMWLALSPWMANIPAVYFLGRAYGPTGQAAGYVALAVLLWLPTSLWIWFWARREWHGDSAAETSRIAP